MSPAKQFDQAFLKLDTWCKSTRGLMLKEEEVKVKEKEVRRKPSFFSKGFFRRKKSFRR